MVHYQTPYPVSTYDHRLLVISTEVGPCLRNARTTVLLGAHLVRVRNYGKNFASGIFDEDGELRPLFALKSGAQR